MANLCKDDNYMSRIRNKLKNQSIDVKPKLLNEANNDFLEFELETTPIPTNSPINKVLSLIKSRNSSAKKPADDQKSGAKNFQRWKMEMEQRMKVKRDIEMAKREEMYLLEQEEIVGKGKNENNGEEEEDEEILSENESDNDPELSSASSVEDETEKVASPTPIEVNILAPENPIERMFSTPQNDNATEELHLFLDTEDPLESQISKPTQSSSFDILNENDLDKFKLKPNDTMISNDTRSENVLKNLGMDPDLTSQQAKDEVLMLLTNPFNSSQDSFSLDKENKPISPKISFKEFLPAQNDENISELPCLDLPKESVPSENALNGPGLNQPKQSLPSQIDENVLDGPPLDQSDHFNESENEESNIETIFDEEFNEESRNEEINLCKRRRQISSDDEEEEISRKPIKRGSKVAIAKLSDEEDNEETEDIDGESSEEDEQDSEGDHASIKSNNAYNDEEDEEMEMAQEIVANRLFDAKTGRIRNEFLENEAELSGSDAGSDDEPEEGDDELEVEDGDLDDLPPDDELQAQIEKIHHKQMLHDDQRQLKLYQEAYLPDGEIHADSDLIRRFRWRKADDDIDLNADPNQALDENEAQMGDEDVMESWRVIQQEKAEFLLQKGLKPEEFEEKSLDADLDTFQMFQVNRINIRRSTSYLQTSFAHIVTPSDQSNILSGESNGKESSQRDSFLTRQQSVLSRIASSDFNPQHSNSCHAASLFISEKSCSNDGFAQRQKFRAKKAKKDQNPKEKPAPTSSSAQNSIFSMF